MKTKLSLTLMMLLALGTGAMAQKKEKFNIYLNMEKNGKDIHVDTSFATREEMETFMKANGFSMTEMPAMPDMKELALPELPELPELPDVEQMIIQIDDSKLSEDQKKEIRKEMKAAKAEMEKAREEMKSNKKEMEKARQEMKRIRIQVSDSGKTGENFYFHHDGNSQGTEGKRKMVIVEVDGEDGGNKYEYKVFKMPCDSVRFWQEKEEGEVKIMKKSRLHDVEEPKNENTSQVIVIVEADNSPETKAETEVNEQIIQETSSVAPVVIAESKNDDPSSKPATDSYKLEASDFKLYPNPTQGKINVSFRLEQSGQVQVRLLDAGGRVIVDEQVEVSDGHFNKEYSIVGKARGTYLLQLKQGDKWRHEKVVVK